MSSSTSLPLPPPSPTANASIPSTTNDDGDNDIGPVTKLAQKAAIEEQERKQKQAKIDAENLRQMAAVVGSTANALSIATKTGSPVRLSPKQKYSVELNKGSSPKLSVAARARMMADVPSMPLRRGQQQQQKSIPQLQQQPQLTNSSNDTNSKSINRKSGTNISKAKQLLEEYGYEDNTTSNENTTDEEEEDYYYDVPREDLFHTPRTPTNNNNKQHQGQKFKSPLERSALQYTMSKSPDPYGVTTTKDTNEFHYQHHKVSSYNNSKQQNQPNENSYVTTDMYGLDPDEIPEIQPSTSSQSQSSGGGGLFATAKGWLQSQRDKLHQLELQRQVEDQRRKLVEEGRKQRLIEAERRRNFYRDGNNNMNWNSPSRGKKKQMGQGQSTTTTPERLRQQGMINEVSSSVQQQGNNIGTSSSFGCIDNSVLSNISKSGSYESSSNEQRSSHLPTTSFSPPQDDSESIEEEDDKPSAVITGMPGICDFGGVYTTNDQYDTVEDYAGVPRVDSRGNVLEMIPSGSMDANDDDDPLDSTEIDGIEDGEGNIGIGIGYGKDGKDMKVCMKISSPKPSVSGAGMSVNVDIPIPFDTRNDYGVHNGGGRRYNNAEEQVQHEQPQEQELEEDDEDDPYFNSDIKIVPEPPQDDSLSSSPILQLSQMKSLISSGGLPPSLNFCKWKRLYSLTRDGDSFDQFLRMVEGHDRTVLVVKTTRNELFGGYADTRWEGRHRRQQAHDFYGSAQACLFKFPNYIGGGEVESLNQHKRGVNKIIIYKWSGANRYIQLCDVAKRTVAFGGGGDEGDFGLCIEDDFRRGTTGHCSTFENDPLCEEGFFDVMDLEVWGFTLDF